MLPSNIMFCIALIGALAFSSLAAGQVSAEPMPEPIAAGPFEPTWDSLMQYDQPEWFRDAKLGIWAHWGAQSQPEWGDWYARLMYWPKVDPKSWEFSAAPGAYRFHVGKYGHPSEFGFKDVINQWKAERFEPDKLLTRYKRAGAKYFVAMANHHCNFDAWNSKHHAWNSVNVGPKKDLVALWAKATRHAGLRFGVSVHAARAWEWYESAQGADVDGPLAGVPYDGKLTKADGKGKWWEGLDPQELYAQNHKPGEKPDQAYRDKFYLRTKDLLDSYRPDLVYFDDWRLPLSESIGLNLAAHYYNSSRQWNGANQAVMTTKGLSLKERKALTLDIERGNSDRIEPYPWQSCTCIGGWHYNASIHANHGYKNADRVLCMLADIVSRNGNMLLSVPVRGDGTIDDQEEKILDDMAAWMEVNANAIHATRPWNRFGEGPSTRQKGGMYSETNRPFSPRDIRFTTRDGALYAIVLGEPADGTVLIRSLARSGATPQITSARVLGQAADAELRHDENGLQVAISGGNRPAGPIAIRIPGAAGYLAAVVIDESAGTPVGDAPVTLGMDTVVITGEKAFVEQKTEQGNIGGWTVPTDAIAWEIAVKTAGTYTVTIGHAGPAASLAIECAAGRTVASLPKTASYLAFVTTPAGEIALTAGQQTLVLRPADPATWKPINLSEVTLVPKPAP